MKIPTSGAEYSQMLKAYKMKHSEAGQLFGRDKARAELFSKRLQQQKTFSAQQKLEVIQLWFYLRWGRFESLKVGKRELSQMKIELFDEVANALKLTGRKS